MDEQLLYLDVRPLGLQALHTGQDLLLVAGQTHTHLSQLTGGRTGRPREQEQSRRRLSERSCSGSLMIVMIHFICVPVLFSTQSRSLYRAE